jgi:tetratricopeptide (TPR) repeat protein
LRSNIYSIQSDILRENGKYELGMDLLSKCLKIQENIKGKNSFATSVTLNNMGLVYDNQGDYSKAIIHYEKCLEIEERDKGKDSIDTVVTLNNIGLVYKNKGDYPKAI